jgi:rhodanese-related sulfurtransferase
MFGFLKNLFGPKTDFAALIQNGAVILDVRTPDEYRGGHIKGSINIPVQSLAGQVAKVKAMGKPVITCCASGMRSGMAVQVLKQNGIEAYNGGAWSSVSRYVNK